MNQINNLSKLNTASFFSKETLMQITETNADALSANVARWIKNDKLIQLKKGLYVTKQYYQSIVEKQNYLEFIANILKKPSYLSGEYVLQKYSILTESVFAITSVTLKKTRTYQNTLGTFSYANLKKDLFTGYKIIDKNGVNIKEATKAKALFDFLYFRLWRLPIINKEIIESFRLNLGEFSKQDFVEFNSYLKLSKIKKFNKIGQYLKEIINDN